MVTEIKLNLWKCIVLKLNKMQPTTTWKCSIWIMSLILTLFRFCRINRLIKHTSSLVLLLTVGWELFKWKLIWLQLFVNHGITQHYTQSLDFNFSKPRKVRLCSRYIITSTTLSTMGSSSQMKIEWIFLKSSTQSLGEHNNHQNTSRSSLA